MIENQLKSKSMKHLEKQLNYTLTNKKIQFQIWFILCIYVRMTQFLDALF